MSARVLRALAAGAVALAAITTVTACGEEERAGGRHRLTLEIGGLVPLSGSEQQFGASGQKAANLAVEQVRAAVREVKAAHAISIAHQNYRSEPRLAQDLAGRMVRAGTSCLVGPWSSAATIPVATTIAVPKKVLQISPGASSDAINKLMIGGYLNRTIAPSRLQGPALATLIADELGGAREKKVSVGAAKNIYGTDLAASFSAAWQKLGGKVVARVVYEQNLPDYKKQAQDLVAPKPDAFAFFDFHDTYTRIATDLIKTGKWKPDRSFATDSLAAGTLGASGGATVEGLRGVAPGWPRSNPLSDAFARLWVSGPVPKYRQPYDPGAFDAVVLCYLSAVAGGSTRGSVMRDWVRRVSAPPGTKYTWQQLPEAIRALEAGKEIDYDGASGPIDMDAQGNPTVAFYDAYRFTDGRLTLYGSVSVPAGEQGLERYPVKFLTPKVPGLGPSLAPTAPAGVTGATGATGANGANEPRPSPRPGRRVRPDSKGD